MDGWMKRLFKSEAAIESFVCVYYFNTTQCPEAAEYIGFCSRSLSDHGQPFMELMLQSPAIAPL